MRTPQDPNAPQDNKNMWVAVFLSLAILFGFHHFYEKPRLEKMRAVQKEVEAVKAAAPEAAMAEAVLRPREAVLAVTDRIIIEGGKLSGSLSLVGGRIDDLSLNEHYTRVTKEENVQLLSPSGTAAAYYVESGWVAEDKNVSMPDAKTLWRLSPESPRTLKSGGAVTLVWDNGAGLMFEREIALDENYLFTVTQRVLNKTGRELKFSAYHLVSRHSLPVDYQGFFILHEGPIAYLNGKLHEPAYQDVAEGERVEVDGAKGWIGITDKYWFVGILPTGDQAFNARIAGAGGNGKTLYQADIVTPLQSVAAGGTLEDRQNIFAGVKRLPVLKAYAEKFNIDQLDLTLDFGMWYFITKPFYIMLHHLIDFTSNVGMAILLITIIVRAFVFPLASKSYRSMAGMKKVAPMLKELQDKYKDNREKLQIEIFELYKRENVNPFSGCWPLLVQIPIFFALYKCILMSVELRQAPFWGWIDDLSSYDPTTIFNLFGLIPWTPPSFLILGAWPCLFCLTMIAQKRLSPPMADPLQEKIQSYFPYVITIMLAKFSAGLVIYWTWSNILGVLQQYYIMNKVMGEKVSIIRGHAARRGKKKHANDHDGE